MLRGGHFTPIAYRKRSHIKPKVVIMELTYHIAYRRVRNLAAFFFVRYILEHQRNDNLFLFLDFAAVVHHGKVPRSHCTCKARAGKR